MDDGEDLTKADCRRSAKKPDFGWTPCWDAVLEEVLELRFSKKADLRRAMAAAKDDLVELVPGLAEPEACSGELVVLLLEPDDCEGNLSRLIKYFSALVR